LAIHGDRDTFCLPTWPAHHLIPCGMRPWSDLIAMQTFNCSRSVLDFFKLSQRTYFCIDLSGTESSAAFMLRSKSSSFDDEGNIQ
jgi:hypothetical protein